jgi:CheY-like chemotaxis protein
VTVFGATVINTNDPVCEAAKAAQNQIYASQKAACEVSKAAERSECEVRKMVCGSVAKACSDVRGTPGASRLAGSRTLWVDDHPDNVTYERQALAELGVEVVLARNTQEALEKLQSGMAKVDTIISGFGRSDDPQGGYTLLESVLKLSHPPPYIIYSTSLNSAFVAAAKSRGVFGATSQAKELFELVIESVKKRR